MASASPEREVWLFDSWAGLPEPSDEDVTFGGLRRPAGWNFARPDDVWRAIHATGANPKKIHLVEGWFHETLPRWIERGELIALLHIDSDWYESVSLCLREMWPLVAAGGAVVVDDYARWRGCRRAVDEFLAEYPADATEVDATAISFRKLNS
jgi:hypothetical protein